MAFFKYELIPNLQYKEFGVYPKYQLKALCDFADVKTGDLGGFVSGPDNLSHEGNCWVYDEAELHDESRVRENAVVRENAKMYNKTLLGFSAKLTGSATMRDNAVVLDHVVIDANALVRGNALIQGAARITGRVILEDKASISGRAHIKDHAKVCDRAKIGSNAVVGGMATINGSAVIAGNAVVDQSMIISFGMVNTDLTKNLKDSLRCQTGLAINPATNTVICYKRVNKSVHKILPSLFDPNFLYEVGKYAVAPNPVISNESCTSGLHFSYTTYWDDFVSCKTTVLLCCEVHFDDIITVQEGKIRAKKCFVHGICD